MMPRADVLPRVGLTEHSRRIVRGRIQWHVQVTGTGPAALLVHGTGSSSHSFRALMPLLAEQYTVVAPDLPGHALTSASAPFQPTLPSMTAALDDLLDALRIEPTLAIGHSAGAAIVVQMTLDGLLRPRRLVGLCAALTPFRGLARGIFPATARAIASSTLAAKVIALRARDRRVVERMLTRTGSRLDAASVDLYARLMQSERHVMGVLSMMSQWDLEPLFAGLGRLDAPLLLLAGAHDRAVPLSQQRAVMSRTPHARLVVFEGAGHLLHEERPAEAARTILQDREH